MVCVYSVFVSLCFWNVRRQSCLLVYVAEQATGYLESAIPPCSKLLHTQDALRRQNKLWKLTNGEYI